MHDSSIVHKVFAAFAQDTAATPKITLRGGNAIDDDCSLPPFDPVIDRISDAYMEKYHWGVCYLDPDSWRHYLPHLIEYALRDLGTGSLSYSALLNSLRTPDRDPPRLATLTEEQESAIVQALEAIAFTEGSVDSEHACQVLEKWWIPNALYRPAQE